MPHRIPFLILPILLLTPPVARSGPSASFSIVQRWHIGGEGAWNRLVTDPENHRLYLTRSDKIIVVDTLTGKRTGAISGSKSVRSICLNPNGQTAYFTDGANAVVRVFDRQSLQVTASIPAGTDPDAAAFDLKSNTLLVLNDGSQTATLIDTPVNRSVATIALPGRPAAAVTDGQGVAFVNINDSKELIRIDLLARKLTARWLLAGCSGPSGLALNPVRHQLYSVCENNRLLVSDDRTGRLLSDAELPEGTREIAFDPRRNLLFAASGSGTLTILETSRFGRVSVLQTVKTMPGARTLALDSTTGRVYLDTAEFGLRTGETSEELRFRPTPIANSFLVLVIAASGR